MFDRDIYFDGVRNALFGGALTQMQVDGQNVLLGMYESGYAGTPFTDLRWLAYLLSSVYHETAQRMWPLREFGEGAGHDYGEVDPETGQAYYGRGLIQITWRDNYSRASKKLSLSDERDLEWHPDVALDSLVAARIAFRGMAEAWFTGKKLGEFFNDTADDPVGARAIINNDVGKNGQKIADYHADFLDAIKKAETGARAPTEEVVVRVIAPEGVEIVVEEAGY